MKKDDGNVLVGSKKVRVETFFLLDDLAKTWEGNKKEVGEAVPVKGELTEGKGEGKLIPISDK